MTFFPADPAYVKPLGRTTPTEKGLWLCWSGSGAEFTFTGKECRITLWGDDLCPRQDSDENLARIAVEIDGERVVSQLLEKKENVFSFSFPEGGQHLVRILKLSETAMSTCVLCGIELDGVPAPTPKKARSIEIIGDSITCGYGIDDPVADHPFHTKTEDATQAYAYLAAKQLDADYSLVSISGWGIISGYTGTGERQSHQMLPPIYHRAGFCHQGFDGKKPQDLDWDFSRFTPDAVVINLGTNDDSFTLDYPERQAEYCAQYQAFLKKVRTLNPSATILCALGIMGDRLFPMVEKAANLYSQETGDKNIHTLHFTPQTAEDGYSSDWHPSKSTQKRAADVLTEKLRSVMGW